MGKAQYFCHRTKPMKSEKQKYDFDTPIDRRKTNSVKWGSRTVNRESLTSLSVADMDFAVDEHIVAALKKRIEHPIFGYEFMPDSLSDLFCEWQLRHHGFNVDKESILYLPGVVNGIAISILTLSEPGDGVVIQPPVYPPFFGVVENNDRTLLLNPLLYNAELASWSMDLTGLEELFLQNRPRLMLLCNPHNPVGRVWRGDELKELCDLCQRYDVVLISDDIHSDFIFSGHSYTPLANVVSPEGQGFVQLLSPAKTFNIPGLGLAYALIPDAEQRKAVQDKVGAMGLAAPNILASTAVQAAYKHGGHWFDSVKHYIEKNHQEFREQISTGLPWARVSPFEGSFVAWVDLRESGLGHAELAHIIRHEAKLMLFDGLSFGDNGEFFFRFNLASPRSVLQQGVEDFIRALTVGKERGRFKISLDNVIERKCCG